MPAEVIEQDLRARWSQVVCWFPALKQGIPDRDNPLSAYVFVRAPLSPRIERSPYALRLLRDPRTHELQKVTDHELRQMVLPPELPEPFTTVHITSGDWAGLSGTVVERNCKTVKVLVELWSSTRIVTLEPSEYRF